MESGRPLQGPLEGRLSTLFDGVEDGLRQVVLRPQRPTWTDGGGWVTTGTTCGVAEDVRPVPGGRGVTRGGTTSEGKREVSEAVEGERREGSGGRRGERRDTSVCGVRKRWEER